LPPATDHAIGVAVVIELAQSLTICDREPIHVPGAVQYGLLLVVDPATDVIAQAAGDTAPLLAVDGALPGRTVQEVLGMPLAALLRRAEVELTPEPAYLGTVGPFGDGAELTLLAHEVQGLAVLEVEPAARSAPTASTLASIRSITEHIGRATTVLEASVVAARHVRRATGYDRVMIYRFLPDGSGSVIAETRTTGWGLSSITAFPGPTSQSRPASCIGATPSASSRTWATARDLSHRRARQSRARRST
jgi:light-regulated signal transduction histidine kinase (bacteriophytochrome)